MEFIRHFRPKLSAGLRYGARKLNRAPVAILLVVLIFVAWDQIVRWRRAPQRLEEHRYLLARREIAVDTPFRFEDFTLVTRSADIPVPPGALTDQDLALLRGAVTREVVNRGVILAPHHLHRPSQNGALSDALTRGQRAYVLYPEVCPRVSRGERVDILLKPEDQTGRSIRLVEGVVVMASSIAPDGAELVIAASQEEVEVLESARGSGKLSVVLRSREDVFSAPSRLRIPKKKKRTVKPARAEVWIEDQR